MDLKPGAYYGMSEREYNEIPALRSSELRKFMEGTPAHYAYRCKQPQKDTPAFAEGREFHMAVLEPQRFAAHVKARPAMPTAQDLGFPDFRTNAAREARDAAIAEIEAQLMDAEFVLDSSQRQMVLEMANSLRNDMEFGDLMTDPHETEVTLLWECEETGLRRKCRIDIWIPTTRQVVELKGTKVTATPERFRREMQRYGYPSQCSYYLDGVRAVFGETHKTAPVIVAVVEKFPPYLPAVRQMDLGSLLVAAADNSAALREYAHCVRTGVWPGHDPCIPWSLDTYGKQEPDITFPEESLL